MRVLAASLVTEGVLGGRAVLGRVLAMDELIALRPELIKRRLEVFKRSAGFALLRVCLAQDLLISCSHSDRIRGIDNFLFLRYLCRDVGNLLVQLIQRMATRWARHRA
jgi:hypothetical protein